MLEERSAISNNDKKKPLGARLGEGFFCVIYLVYTFALVFIMKGRYDSLSAGTESIVPTADNMEIYRYGFGYMLALLLVGGDAFHLIPRIIYDFRGKLEKKDFLFGLGSLISSITMTVFYNILISFGDTLEYNENMYNLFIEKSILVLTIIRILILLLPWNRWYTSEPNRKWAIIRNTPFMIIGLLIVCGFINILNYTHNYSRSFYIIIMITVIFSFIFYLPVAVFGKEKPAVGMLMIPKTICYMIMLSVICFY